MLIRDLIRPTNLKFSSPQGLSEEPLERVDPRSTRNGRNVSERSDHGSLMSKSSSSETKSQIYSFLSFYQVVPV